MSDGIVNEADSTSAITPRFVVCVIGSRLWVGTQAIYSALDYIDSNRRISQLVHGGAEGADWIASGWAKIMDIPCAIYEASWDLLGKAAGPARNLKMLDEAKPDLVVGFPFGASRGTYHCIVAAEERNIKTWIPQDIFFS